MEDPLTFINLLTFHSFGLYCPDLIVSLPVGPATSCITNKRICATALMIQWIGSECIVKRSSERRFA